MKKATLTAVAFLIAAACGTSGTTDTTTTTDVRSTTAETTTTTPPPATTTTAPESASFPVTVMDDLGPVTIEERPESIVSLSATATEMLFAMGAGEQVVAVDDQSDHPEEAPVTDLSGFTPNIEAVLSYEPDLVVISFDPADNPISESLEAVGVQVLFLSAAMTIDDTYRQIELIGEATGNLDAAMALNDQIANGLDGAVAEAGGIGEGVTYYHELDSALFSVTSSTFIGELYGLLGLENIADPADEDGSAGGFPQLSSEFIVSADPDIIFLADAEFGESLETLSERSGWGEMTAIQSGAVVELDSDIASRWGPRIVDFLQVMADAVAEHAPVGAG